MTIKAQGWQAGLTGSAWSQPRDLWWRLIPVAVCILVVTAIGASAESFAR
ncbi:MAG: hypothetical protein ACLPXU_05635 [Acidimicrobiales bacterium]|jgi:hypothetical protein